MPAALPPADPAPADGRLPESALAELATGAFGVYVHVPFCRTRCGYCDFNTYTAAELAGTAGPDTYVAAAIAELRLARRVLADRDLPVDTVFFGGGTPTLLAPAALGAILRVIDTEFGLAPGAEITTEANPESVDRGALDRLRAAGFSRLSLGMQSARPHVLAALDRKHTPGRSAAAAREARAAGFGSVSLDLIYGGPGESMTDWTASLDAVVGSGVDHVSAYALVVEEGTALARRVRHGDVPAPDDDDLAAKYERADATLVAAGYGWYEISNWARPGHECRHNVGYWRGAAWWGVGPGAHSHVGGARWWNVKSPRAYADRLAAGTSPAAGRELLDAGQRRTEEVLLGMRVAAGLPLARLGPTGGRAAATLAADRLLDVDAYAAGRAVLTLQGRLLADTVVRALVS